MGAASELKDGFKDFDWSKVNRYFCAQKIYFKWIFHSSFYSVNGRRLGIPNKIKHALNVTTLHTVFADEVWVETHMFFRLFLEYMFSYLWMIIWMKNVNNFQIAKVEPQGAA